VGLVLAIPGFVGNAFDPVVGALGDTGRRRAVLFAGGLAFALSAALTSAAVGFWTLLVALVIGNPASGAFVSLAQATLMDLGTEAPPAAPHSGGASCARASVCAAGRERSGTAHGLNQRERRMAWWTLAGSFGYVGGPVLLAAALWVGLGWRGALFALALAALPLAFAARAVPFPRPKDGASLVRGLISALRALGRREVLRWLALLEAADLLLDVLFGFLALYLVDVAGWSPTDAALGVAVWTGAGLVGDALLIPLLRRVRGAVYLRASALAALGCYPLFLVVPGFAPKLVLLAVLGLLNTGWYAIPKAGLYGALPGQSGAAIALGGLAGFAGALVPLGVGLVAEAAGLAPAMWLLLAAPVALLALVPRR
jgi:FSR family fosmidomycin resistance protein-like MFS transporter